MFRGRLEITKETNRSLETPKTRYIEEDEIEKGRPNIESYVSIILSCCRRGGTKVGAICDVGVAITM